MLINSRLKQAHPRLIISTSLRQYSSISHLKLNIAPLSIFPLCQAKIPQDPWQTSDQDCTCPLESKVTHTFGLPVYLQEEESNLSSTLPSQMYLGN